LPTYFPLILQITCSGHDRVLSTPSSPSLPIGSSCAFRLCRARLWVLEHLIRNRSLFIAYTDSVLAGQSQPWHVIPPCPFCANGVASRSRPSSPWIMILRPSRPSGLNLLFRSIGLAFGLVKLASCPGPNLVLSVYGSSRAAGRCSTVRLAFAPPLPTPPSPLAVALSSRLRANSPRGMGLERSRPACNMFPPGAQVRGLALPLAHASS